MESSWNHYGLLFGAVLWRRLAVPTPRKGARRAPSSGAQGLAQIRRDSRELRPTRVLAPLFLIWLLPPPRDPSATHLGGEEEKKEKEKDKKKLVSALGALMGPRDPYGPIRLRWAYGAQKFIEIVGA